MGRLNGSQNMGICGELVPAKVPQVVPTPPPLRGVGNLGTKATGKTGTTPEPLTNKLSKDEGRNHNGLKCNSTPHSPLKLIFEGYDATPVALAKAFDLAERNNFGGGQGFGSLMVTVMGKVLIVNKGLFAIDGRSWC